MDPRLSSGQAAQRGVRGLLAQKTGWPGVFLLFMLVTSVTVYAQETTIRGKVTDAADGRGLPGVNVFIKGTAHGTITDNDGNYQLTMPDSSMPLVFSFVGMVTQELMLQGRSTVDIQLEQDVRQLQEVVVSALGIDQDRDKVGTASNQIKGGSIVRSGEPTLLNGLSAKSSGLIVNRSAGDPGSGSYIQIRGQSSIMSSVQPLIVVDGVPAFNTNFQGASGPVGQSRINDINPSDIESVEVLKGASASALWGTRAGNGVIMITTKKGRSEAGKVNISYSGSYSVDEILVKHPLQTSYGQGTKGSYFTNVLGSGVGWANSFGDKIANRPGTSDSVITDQGYFQTPDERKIYPIAENGGKRSRQVFDPYQAVMGRGNYYDQTLSISGGNKDGNYYISIGDLDQKGIVKDNSTFRRTSFRVNSERRFNDWLKIKSSFMYSHITRKGIVQGNSTLAVMFGLRTPPDWDNSQGYTGIYYNPSGTAFINRQLAYRNQIGKNGPGMPAPVLGPGYDNPVWSMYNDRVTTEVDRFMASMEMEVNPTKWLSAVIRPGVDMYTEGGTAFFLPGGVAGNPVGSGTLTIFTTKETQFNLDAFARGQFSLSPGIHGSAVFGFNTNQRTFDDVEGFITNFLISSNPPLSLDNAPATNDNPFNSLQQIRSAAAYGTIDLEYKDQVFLGFTGRAENSSVFSHAKNPTFYYPSASISWHPLKTLGIDAGLVTFGKIRASYGVVSTIPGPYNTVTYWNPVTFGDGYVTLNAAAASYGGAYQQSLNQGNKDLRPETKSEAEGGFDVRFLNDRFSLSATYFTNTIKDAIIPVATAGSTGFTSKTANAAELTNHGLELDFSADVLRLGDFTWNIYGNWTRIRNKVTYLGGDQTIVFAGSLLGDGTAVVGQPVGIHYGNTFDHYDEDSLILDGNGFPKPSPTATVVGNPNPDWRLGLGLRLTWKDLSLNVLFEHSHGGQIHGGTRGALIAHGTHKDTDREVTLSAAEASTIKNYSGSTVDTYGYKPNADGSYTVRGYLQNFGAGPVLIDEAWWTSLGGGFNTANLTSQFIEPAQWTKLREVSLQYTLRSPGFKSMSKLRSVDFIITGRNLLLWTEFKGNDPETNVRGPSNTQARDYFNNPATRSLLLTININY